MIHGDCRLSDRSTLRLRAAKRAARLEAQGELTLRSRRTDFHWEGGREPPCRHPPPSAYDVIAGASRPTTRRRRTADRGSIFCTPHSPTPSHRDDSSCLFNSRLYNLRLAFHEYVGICAWAVPVNTCFMKCHQELSRGCIRHELLLKVHGIDVHKLCYKILYTMTFWAMPTRHWRFVTLERESNFLTRDFA